MKRTLLVLVILLALPLAVHAQTATPEAPDAAVTAPAPNVTVVNEAPASNGIEISSLLLLLVGSIIGGLAVGTPLLYVITHMTTAQKDAAEKLFLSQPPANIEKERAIIDVLDRAVTIFGAVLGVVKGVTDGLPNDDEPKTLQFPSLDKAA